MKTPPLNLETIDFRLLRVFDVVLEHKSLTRAAQKLGISQPAVSQALGRLRNRFVDPLFVRSTDGLMPTPRALQLAPTVRRILLLYRDELAAPVAFDPAATAREFGCYITDLGAIVVLPLLMRQLKMRAPGLRLRTTSIDSSGIPVGLESGLVDLAIGPFPRMPGGIFRQRLFEDDSVCLVRTGHPLVRRGLDVEAFQHAEHVLVSTSGSGHAFNPQVEMAIAERVPASRIRLRAHSFMVAAFLLRGTDLVLTAPRRSGELLAQRFDLRILEVPIVFRKLEIHQYWHERFHHDAGHRWLRSLVGELFNQRRVAVARHAGV